MKNIPLAEQHLGKGFEKNGKFPISGDLIPGFTNNYWTCTMSISRGWVRASRQAVRFVGKTRAYSRKGCLVRLTEDRLGDRVNHKIPASRGRRRTSFFLLPAPLEFGFGIGTPLSDFFVCTRIVLLGLLLVGTSTYRTIGL